MDCVACHPAREMHAAAPKDLPGRYQLAELARCTDCHEDLQHGSVRDHAIHIGKVQCQVCHSQTYVNCYGCHVGKDAEGTAYFQNRGRWRPSRSGSTTDARAPGAGYRYRLVRHVPSYPEMFDFYGKDLFTGFGNVPTWKRASPHNIQRRTWQAASCNNCHGNRALFLASADLQDFEKQANRRWSFPTARCRSAIARDAEARRSTRARSAPAWWWTPGGCTRTSGRRASWSSTRAARTEYDKGHVEGAVSLDPMTSGFRTGGDAEKPFTLWSHAEVAAILGRAGLAAGDHIVVYDQKGLMATRAARGPGLGRRRRTSPTWTAASRAGTRPASR